MGWEEGKPTQFDLSGFAVTNVSPGRDAQPRAGSVRGSCLGEGFRGRCGCGPWYG